MKMTARKNKIFFLNEKIKCLEIKNKMLHDKIISLKEKQCASFEHEN